MATNASTYFGVDSAAPITQAVLDTITTRAGTKPAFAARYLSGRYATTTAEIAFLHGQGIAVGFCYDNYAQLALAGGDTMGAALGSDAVAAAHALAVPAGVCLYLDVEADSPVTGALLAAYAGVVAGAGYLPGVYGTPTVWPGFTLAYQAMRAAHPGPVRFWSSEPELWAWADTVRFGFTPATVAGYPADCVLHQYAENSFGGIVDLDVASTLDGFWLPAAPLIWRTTAAGALKSAANHVCRPAIDPAHQPVYLQPGVQVIPTGPAVVTDDTWTPVRLPNSPVHGWYPTLHLAQTS